MSASLNQVDRPRREMALIEGREVVIPLAGEHVTSLPDGGAEASAALFNLDKLIDRPQSVVMFVEGEKAAAAFDLHLPEMIAVTTVGGADAEAETDLSALVGRHVLIWPDNDVDGLAYAERIAERLHALDPGKAQVRILRPIRFRPGVDKDGLPVLEPGFDPPTGWGAADAFGSGWTEAHFEMLLRRSDAFMEVVARPVALPALVEVPFASSVEPAVPDGFFMDESGVYYKKPSKGGGIDFIWLCSPVRVVALARTGFSDGWGTVVEFNDADGVTHEWCIQQSMFGSELGQICATLLSMGAQVTSNGTDRQHLSRYLQSCDPSERRLAITQPGWNNGCFVFPDGTVLGTGAQRIAYETRDPTGGRMFGQSGDLEQWKESVAAVCEGNSRLVLALCTALAGPVLNLLEEESGGFHFRGPSSIGKTTTLLAASSVFGDPGRVVKRWRATANGLEATAAQYNDLMLPLDEMSQISAREAGAAAYMLANGQGKARANMHGGARAAASWRLLILSTGEISLADHLADDGIRAMAGQQTRLVDITADAGAGNGLYEELHWLEDGKSLSDHIKTQSAANYGSAGRAFVEALADPDRRADILAEIQDAIEDFEDDVVPAAAAGQVHRVAHRFALVAAVGEACIALGILPWAPGHAKWGCERCFANWLEQRGGPGNLEADQAVRQVRHHLETFGTVNYPQLQSTNPAIDPGESRMPVYGYRRRANDGRTEYLILGDAFKINVCTGLDASSVVSTLKEQGFLIPAGTGNNQQQIRLPGGGRTRVYVISADLFGEADNPTSGPGGSSGLRH